MALGSAFLVGLIDYLRRVQRNRGENYASLHPTLTITTTIDSC